MPKVFTPSTNGHTTSGMPNGTPGDNARSCSLLGAKQSPLDKLKKRLSTSSASDGQELKSLSAFEGDSTAQLLETMSRAVRQVKEDRSQALPFPTQVYPEALKRFVEETANSLPCPPDFLGSSILANVGSFIGPGRPLEIKPGWQERPVIYAINVASPGSRKSPALEAAIAPARERDRLLAKEHLKDVAEYKDRQRQAKAKQQQFDDSPPIAKQHITTDCTVESLADVLTWNRKLLVYRDEATGLVSSFNQYKGGKGADKEFWESAWSCQDYTVNRKGQAPLRITRPFICVNGNIPPDMLGELGDRKGRADGFLDRFLFSYPEPVQVRWTNESPNPSLLKGYTAACLRIDELSDAVLTVTADARESFKIWYDEHHRSFDGPAGAWAKMDGYCARFASIIHHLRYAYGDVKQPDCVDSISVNSAILLVEYFKNHARRALGQMNAGREGRTLARLLSFIANAPGYKVRPRALIGAAIGDVMDDWQMDDFSALDPALMRAAGRGNEPAKMRAWLERPRGHSKTTDLAVTCCYALAFATRPLRGYAYAADKDQAGLLKQAIGTILRLNPWLGSILSVESHRVINVAKGHPAEGGTLTIEASDVGSSYGILPDIIIADEVCHWEGDGSLWHSLISSAAKRSNCLLVVISNAGFVDSWQWNIREAARTDEAWYFSRLDGPRASWMTEARLAEQQRMLPGIAFARLWLNEWSSGGGDALRREDIDQAFVEGLEPLPPRLSGWSFVAGLDLGISRDSSVLAVLGIRKCTPWEFKHSDHGKTQLAYIKRWQPPKGGKVDLTDVEETILDLHGGYNFAKVYYDPWQAEAVSQKLRLKRVKMEELTQTGSNLQRIATATIEAFNDHRLLLFEHPDLRRDLYRLRIEERSYGFRLTSPRDGTGHGDCASAFCYALLAAEDVAGAVQRRAAVHVDGGGLYSIAEERHRKAKEQQRAWARRQEEYRRERQFLDNNNDSQSESFEILQAMFSRGIGGPRW